MRPVTGPAEGSAWGLPGPMLSGLNLSVLVLGGLTLGGSALSGCVTTAPPVPPRAASPDVVETAAKPVAEPAPLRPALPPVTWPEAYHRLPAAVAYLEAPCVVTVEGQAYCWGQAQTGHALTRVDPAPLSIMFPAARSRGCRDAADAGAACAAALQRSLDAASDRRLGKQSVVGATRSLVWSRKRVFGRRYADPVPPDHGGRPPKAVDQGVLVSCEDGTPGVLWRQGPRVHGCGFDVRAWTDVAQFDAGDDVACAVERGGTLRCARGNERPEWAPEGVVAGITGAVEVTVGMRAACVRTEDGRVTCFGNTDSLPRDPAGEAAPPSPSSAPARFDLELTGVDAIDLHRERLCVAKADVVYCAGVERLANTDVLRPVRGLPPVVAATVVDHGGVAIDTQGDTYVWGPATEHRPRRSAVHLAALGAGVAIDDAGSLRQWDAASGYWLTLLDAFWPEPPEGITLAGKQDRGCARAGETTRCWEAPRGRPPRRATEAEVRLRVDRANWTLSDNTLRDADGVVRMEGVRRWGADYVLGEAERLWVFAPVDVGGASGSGRRPPWHALEVSDGAPGPAPAAAPPRAATPPALSTVARPTVDVAFVRVDGHCAATRDGEAWCFGPGARGGHALTRTPGWDGFVTTSRDGRCAVLGDGRVDCVLSGSHRPLSSVRTGTRIVSLADDHWFARDGRGRPRRPSRRSRTVRLGAPVRQVVSTDDHWIALHRDGDVRLTTRKGASREPVFPALSTLDGSEQIAAARRRICGVGGGMVRCVDAEDSPASAHSGAAWTVPELRDATKIVMAGGADLDAGFGRACALRSNGRVVCFGQFFGDERYQEPIVAGLGPSVVHNDEPPRDVGLSAVTDIWLGPRGGLLYAALGRIVGHDMQWAQASAPSCIPPMQDAGAGLASGAAVDAAGAVWRWTMWQGPRPIAMSERAIAVAEDGAHVLGESGDLWELRDRDAVLARAGLWPSPPRAVALTEGCAWTRGKKARCWAGAAPPFVVRQMKGQLAIDTAGAVWGQSRAGAWAKVRWLDAAQVPIGSPGDAVLLPIPHLLDPNLTGDGEPYFCTTEACIRGGVPMSELQRGGSPDEAVRTDAWWRLQRGDVARVLLRGWLSDAGALHLPMPTACYGQGETVLAVQPASA
ncbi:MAG: hypothetical protein AAF721_34850 [Myxococcota bacterium]